MRPEPYVTLDGSTVTELIRPETEGSRNLSVAQAVIQPGRSTLPHSHRNSEEVYYVIQGQGTLRIGARQVEISSGDALLIRPGQEHSAACIGASPLVILCLCAPPYEHEDTQVIGGVVT